MESDSCEKGHETLPLPGPESPSFTSGRPLEGFSCVRGLHIDLIGRDVVREHLISDLSRVSSEVVEPLACEGSDRPADEPVWAGH